MTSMTEPRAADASPAAATENASSASRAGKVAVAVALTLAVGKLVAGLLGNSAAVLASAVDSLMDVFASSANTFAIHLSRAEPDRDHAFGHAKFEALATAGQGLLIGGSAVYIVVEGFHRLLSPQPLRLASVTLGAMGASALCTLLLVAYMKGVAKRTRSKALAADAVHYQTDVWANVAVLAGVGVTYWTGITRIDGALSLLVGAYVFWSAISLLRAGAAELVDASASPEQVAAIEALLDGLIGAGTIEGYHELRTRVAGRMTFVDVHIELPGDMPLAQAHGISDHVLTRLRDELGEADVLIHLDAERDQP